MKLYVLPVESACDAHCSFCITKFRKVARKQLLVIEDLREALEKVAVEKIEITGGGEPTLHPQLETIIALCAGKARTQLYTHGAHLRGNVGLLESLCVSRAHYDDAENERIMGIEYDFNTIIQNGVPLKLSLLLHASGIQTVNEVKKYLQWAQGKAKEVVIRQLFEHDYQGKLDGEFVSSEKIFRQLNVTHYSLTPQENPVFTWGNLKVEMEYRSCACEMDNPVLHADGRLYQGWSNFPYDSHGN